MNKGGMTMKNAVEIAKINIILGHLLDTYKAIMVYCDIESLEYDELQDCVYVNCTEDFNSYSINVEGYSPMYIMREVVNKIYEREFC